jgi:hypothetical protein
VSLDARGGEGRKCRSLFSRIRIHELARQTELTQQFGLSLGTVPLRKVDSRPGGMVRCLHPGNFWPIHRTQCLQEKPDINAILGMSQLFKTVPIIPFEMLLFASELKP